MEATRLYPEVAAAPGRPDLEARVAELERVVATLATLRNERTVERRADRLNEHLDPVAVTAALHPSRMRSARRPKRRSSDNGTLAMRVVLFDPKRH